MRTILAIVRYFDRQSKAKILPIALGGLLLLGLGNLLAAQGTPYETAMTLSYLFPIAFATWHAGGRWGVALSMVAAVLGTVTSGPAPADIEHQFWLAYGGGFTRLAAFLLATLLVATLRVANDDAVDLAHTDPLTGIGNVRWFREQLERELVRCKRYRHPFTVIYGDLDNFKTVNDRLGHGVGDALLREVAGALQGGIRDTDVVARLGGDEFGVLLPETDQAAGYRVTQQLQQGIGSAMKRHAWPVRGSFGVVTCIDPPADVDALLELADQLMYAAKRDAKNGIRCAVLATGAPSSHSAPAATEPHPSWRG